jgi:TMEM175 potassium channel family protein
MRRDRLTAFSDGVIAIIITIMVLELKVPQGTDLKALAGQAPVFLSYVLSFIYVAIYWNNHHHLLHTVARVSGPILWANNNLLFWMSLVPFTTGWMGENHFAALPTAIYGVSLLMPAGAWYLVADRNQPDARHRIAVGQGPGPRHQGQNLATYVSVGDRAGVCQSVDIDRDLYGGRDNLADPRSAHRARPCH